MDQLRGRINSSSVNTNSDVTDTFTNSNDSSEISDEVVTNATSTVHCHLVCFLKGCIIIFYL